MKKKKRFTPVFHQTVLKAKKQKKKKAEEKAASKQRWRTAWGDETLAGGTTA